MLTVPIIILNWNGYKDTIECLDSVLQLKGINFYVYLVDNQSDNNEGELLRKKYESYSNIEVQINDTNLGFALGNNKILAKLLKDVSIRYVALLNNDTVVTPMWLSNLVDSAMSNKAHMVSSKMINYYDRSIMDNAGHYMLNTAEILPYAHGKPAREINAMAINMGACGGAALYDMQMLREIGLFDTFFSTGYEDAELGLRANLLGYKSIFEPTAVIYHKVSRSIKKIKDDNYFVKIQSNIFYTYFKNIPTSHILLNLPWIIFKYLILFIGSILTLQIRVIKLHLKTLYKFFTHDFLKALQSRKALRLQHQKNMDSKTMKRIHFFLRTDIKRFFSLFKMQSY